MYHKDITNLLFVQIPAILVIEDFVGQYLNRIQVLFSETDAKLAPWEQKGVCY